MDSTQIGINATGTLTAGESLGFPTMAPVAGGDSRDNAMTDAKCQQVLNLILQNAPLSVAQTTAGDIDTQAELGDATLFVQASAPTASSSLLLLPNQWYDDYTNPFCNS